MAFPAKALAQRSKHKGSESYFSRLKGHWCRGGIGLKVTISMGLLAGLYLRHPFERNFKMSLTLFQRFSSEQLCNIRDDGSGWGTDF